MSATRDKSQGFVFQYPDKTYGFNTDPEANKERLKKLRKELKRKKFEIKGRG